jgi:hypothetical protein
MNLNLSNSKLLAPPSLGNNMISLSDFDNIDDDMEMDDIDTAKLTFKKS